MNNFFRQLVRNMPQYPGRIFALCMLLIASGLLLQVDAQLKWVGGASFYLQPGFWSVVALVGIVLFAALELFQKLPAVAPAQALQWRQLLQQWLGPVEYALYFLLYVYLVPRLGYLPVTLLVFPLLTLRVGYRGWKMVIYSWVVGFTIVVLFKSILQVKIPGGEIYSLFPDAVRNFLVANF